MKRATLNELAAGYDAFLVDQFGVLLDGAVAYPWAPAALKRLAATGKPVVLLSNSGKRAEPNIRRLLGFGFERGSFLTVLSSGEAAWRMLARRNGGPQTRLWTDSSDGGLEHIAGLDVALVERPEAADLILLSGVRPDRLSLEGYAALLRPAAARGVLLVCSNPDLETLTPRGRAFGPGRVAEAYAAMGGPVEWIGKPHPLIYAEAARLLPPGRVLCVGDSPAHDICGAMAAGHASALVRAGLHAALSDEALAAECARVGAAPDHLLDRFDFEAD